MTNWYEAIAKKIGHYALAKTIYTFRDFITKYSTNY